MRHELKIEKNYYSRIVDGEKLSELRENDRDYQTGDTITFKILVIGEDRDDGAKYDGDYLVLNERYIITHMLQGVAGLEKGYAILSIRPKVSPNE